MSLFVCRVCGLLLPFAPWGEDGTMPSYDYCPCCGIEFGVQDSTYESTKSERHKWLLSGAKWAESQEKPEDWDLAEQLSNVIHERSDLLTALKLAGI